MMKEEMDKAVLFIKNTGSSLIHVSGISTQCYKCDYQPHGFLKTNLSLVVDTRWPYKLQFTNSDKSSVKNLEEHFREYGKYIFMVGNYSGKFNAKYTIENDPINTYVPFIVFMSILVGLAILWPCCKWLRRVYKRYKGIETTYFMEMQEWDNKIESLSRRNTNTDVKKETDNKPKSKRLRSLDTFRGIAIILMIFVNYSGGHYYFIDHAVWNGLTVADLVFPWFIFIMGTSINLSYKSFIKRGDSIWTAFMQILFRSVKLFIIGLVLNLGQNLPTWRIPGVLQRFGVCYFVIGTLNLLTTPSEITLNRWKTYTTMSIFRDVFPFWIQWIFIFGIIAAHTSITFLLHVPGCPKGYLGPGGLAEHGKYFNCTGGAAGYIDAVLLTNKHTYGNPTCKEIYRTNQHFDPEGLLGFLTSIVLTFFGLQAGRILFAYDIHSSRIKRWVIWTVFTGVLAIGLTLGTQDEGIIPINKNLWSISFVLATASTSYLLFICCYVACDVYRVWNGSPFFFCGMNAIFLYVVHYLIPFRVYWHENPQSHASYLFVASVNTAIWIVWAFSLYKKKLFFTV